MKVRKNRPLSDEEMKYHLQMIAFLQHERLVHLPVMLTTLIGFLAMFIITFFSMSLLAFIGMLMLAILSGFYIEHYFFLENTVQDWYRYYTARSNGEPFDYSKA